MRCCFPAAVSSLTGILIYAKFTHIAINIQYGAGFILNSCAIVVSWVGLMLTGAYDHRRLSDVSAGDTVQL